MSSSSSASSAGLWRDLFLQSCPTHDEDAITDNPSFITEQNYGDDDDYVQHLAYQMAQYTLQQHQEEEVEEENFQYSHAAANSTANPHKFSSSSSEPNFLPEENNFPHSQSSQKKTRSHRKHKHRQPSGSGMVAVFLGTGSDTGSFNTGTGVFLPQNSTGGRCSPAAAALIPERVMRVLKLNPHDMAPKSRTNTSTISISGTNNNNSNNNELLYCEETQWLQEDNLGLPQDWTY